MKRVILDPSGKRALLISLMLVFFFLAVSSLVDDSPTMDEQNHIARGLAFLHTGDPRLSVEHPPLINSISALPLLSLPDIRLPTDDPSWHQDQGWYRFAELLLWDYNDDVSRMVFLARMPIVYLMMGLALVGFVFSRSFWGAPAGLVTFLLLLFDPNFLAHGRLATTDVGGTTFLLLAAFLLWRMWSHPYWSWRRFSVASIGLGLAFASKLSTLSFVPIFALMALVPIFPLGDDSPAAGRRRRLVQLFLAGLTSLAVVWLVFAFQWGPLDFKGQWLQGLNRYSAPMPTFWAGIEQILVLSGGGRPTFLLGETSTAGFLAYFPIAFMVKTPLATIALILLASAWLLLRNPRPRDRARTVFLLLPACLYFLMSLFSSLNIGYRHLLPMLPFLFLAAAGGVARAIQQLPASREAQNGRQRALPLALVSLTVTVIAASMFIYPHFISYFNVLAGGPQNGHRILADSNIDWGQDLIRLRDWVEENDVADLRLSWFGTADPAYYGIQYEPLPGLPRHFDLWWNLPFDPEDPDPGTYAISVSNLWELPLEDDKYVFAWFRDHHPVDRVGYSILIFEVPDDDRP